MEGNPIPDVTWYRDGSLITGQRLHFYYIPELLPSLRGYYHCVASYNGDMVESDPVLVSITSKTLHNTIDDNLL